MLVRDPVSLPSVTARHDLRASIARSEVGNGPHACQDQIGPRRRPVRIEIFLAVQYLISRSRAYIERGGDIQLPLRAVWEQVTVAQRFDNRMHQQLACSG